MMVYANRNCDMKRFHTICLTCLLTLAATMFPAVQVQAADTWLLVDTRNRTLQVWSGDRLQQTYDNISIGSGGAARMRFMGESITPLGSFRISSIRKKTRYHRFFALDYPALDQAIRAHAEGKISDSDLASIRHAHEHGLEPPSSTPLGGNIGIHGLGKGDPKIHEDFNWTDGCIALTNKQMDDLAQWVHPRMIVIIR
jgi:murein L,D-transpeptidase YafK